MNHRMLPVLLGSVACLVATSAAAGSSSAHRSEAARSRTAASTTPAPDKTIVETAMAAGSFKTLLAAVDAAGLTATLSGPGPFTVFAPTDAAFAALPPGTVDGLLADKAALTRVLTYHVVAGEVLSSALPGTPTATTVEGSPVRLSIRGGEARINDARIVTTDIRATNGVVHVIDAVILPPPSAGRG